MSSDLYHIFPQHPNTQVLTFDKTAGYYATKGAAQSKLCVPQAAQGLKGDIARCCRLLLPHGQTCKRHCGGELTRTGSVISPGSLLP